MELFSDFSNDNDLIDFPLVGSKFMRTNKQNRLVMSRIDRFLVNKEWEDHLSEAVQIALPRSLSDHRPIKLSSGSEVDWGPRPFRFENC